MYQSTLYRGLGDDDLPRMYPRQSGPNIGTGNAPAPGVGPSTATPPTPPQISPAYLSQLMPGLMSNPATVGGIPEINGMMLDPNMVTGNILGALMPQFAQQNLGLTEQLANAGIVGGSAIGAQGALAAQQQQQALGQIAPIIQSIMQGNQGTDLAAQERNQAAAQQGGEFNASQQNAAQQFDIGNILRAAMSDQGTYNNFVNTVLGGQNQDWLALLGANANLGMAGAGAQAAAFNPVYQQPNSGGNGFSGLGSALANITPTIGGGSAGPALGNFQSGVAGILGAQGLPI